MPTSLVYFTKIVITARSELRKVLFLAQSVTFLFVYEISREPLDGFAPNSQGRSVWSLARMSLKVKVKDQRSRAPGTKTGFSADISRTAERICDKLTRKRVWSLARRVAVAYLEKHLCSSFVRFLLQV